MGNHGLLFDTLIFLLATVVFVPIAKKFGLGSVLGYLLGYMSGRGPTRFPVVSRYRFRYTPAL